MIDLDYLGTWSVEHTLAACPFPTFWCLPDPQTGAVQAGQNPACDQLLRDLGCSAPAASLLGSEQGRLQLASGRAAASGLSTLIRAGSRRPFLRLRPMRLTTDAGCCARLGGWVLPIHRRGVPLGVAVHLVHRPNSARADPAAALPYAQVGPVADRLQQASDSTIGTALLGALQLLRDAAPVTEAVAVLAPVSDRHWCDLVASSQAPTYTSAPALPRANWVRLAMRFSADEPTLISAFGDAGGSTQSHLRDLQRHGIRALACLPLRHGGRSLGYVLLVNRVHPVNWQAAPLAGFQLLVSLMAGAIVRTEQERRLAVLEPTSTQAAHREALAQLADVIIHDAFNGLTGMLGFAEILSQPGQRDAQAQQRAAGQILGAGEHVTRLLRRLRDAARAGEPDRPPPIEAITVADLVNLPVRLLGRRHSYVRVEIDSPHAEDQLRCDPVLVQSSIHNLLLNAAQAIGGSGALVVKARIDNLESASEITPAGWITRRLLPDPWGPRLIIEVCDRGPGLPSAVLPRLFEFGFTTRSASGGSGRGLASVLSAMRLLDGGLSVCTRHGEGSCFRLAIPARDWQPAP